MVWWVDKVERCCCVASSPGSFKVNPEACRRGCVLNIPADSPAGRLVVDGSHHSQPNLQHVEDKEGPIEA